MARVSHRSEMKSGNELESESIGNNNCYNNSLAVWIA